MGETRIFAMPDSGNGGGGTNGLLAMLPALMQQRGLDPNILALANGRNGSNGGWGDGLFAILLLFILMGRGGLWGNQGGGGFMGNGQGGVVPMLNNDANTAVIMQAVQRNGFDIASLATALNTSSDAVLAAINSLGGQICNLGNQMGQNTNQIVTAVMQGNNGIISQLCECCCSIKGLVTEQGYQGQLRTIQQTQDIVQNATSNANTIAAKIDAQTQIINDKFCQLELREMQNKLDSERARSAALAGQLSQEHQTAAIQAYQAQAIAPVNAALGDLSTRLAKIECAMPPTFPMPYTPAAGNYIPMNYSVPVNPLAAPQCGC